MKKILLVLLFLLPFISACQFLLDEFLIEDLGNDDYMCINNFHCIVDLPKEVFVGIELFSSDTLLLVYKRFPESNYVSLPGPKDTLEFGSDLILRLHIFCNGKWLEVVDYGIENRGDKFTEIRLDNFDLRHEDTLGIQIFSDEQLSECPELTGYKIFKNTNHPPSCFVPEISPNQHR